VVSIRLIEAMIHQSAATDCRVPGKPAVQPVGLMRFEIETDACHGYHILGRNRDISPEEAGGVLSRHQEQRGCSGLPIISYECRDTPTTLGRSHSSELINICNEDEFPLPGKSEGTPLSIIPGLGNFLPGKILFCLKAFTQATLNRQGLISLYSPACSIAER
jgi:hypothetical protein